MGVLLMLAASACFATMAAFVKGIGPEAPASQLVFLRSLLALPVLLLLVRRRGLTLVVKAKGVLLVRTALGLAAMHAFYYALARMPLADCIFIGRSQPLVLALLAPLVVGERTPWSGWVAIITGLVGVLLILQPAVNGSPTALAAFFGAVASAGAHLMVRKLNRTEETLAIVLNFLALSALVTAPVALSRFASLTPRQWLLVVGVALFASLGQWLMTEAYRRDRAPAVAAASYSSVLLSLLYGYLFWGEIPNPLAWAGGVLIISGGLLLVVSRRRVVEPPVAG